MNNRYIALLIVSLAATALLLSACQSGEREADEHLLSPHQRALERAEDVEQQLEEADRRRREIIDEGG